jgi:cystathionine beta-lyase/cystathionine gamma-synthase
MRVHERNTHALAQFLKSHPQVERVYYPGLRSHPQRYLAKKQMCGFGGMLSFDIHGGHEAAFRFLDNLRLFDFAESLGGVESLIEHPETMSHASMTVEARAAARITGSNIRVSAGIEHVEDLIEDMRCAFETLT